MTTSVDEVIYAAETMGHALVPGRTLMKALAARPPADRLPRNAIAVTDALPVRPPDGWLMWVAHHPEGRWFAFSGLNGTLRHVVIADTAGLAAFVLCRHLNGEGL